MAKRRHLAPIAALLPFCFFAWPGTAGAQADPLAVPTGQTVKLKGRIVDAICYQKAGAEKGIGVETLPCAREDVKKGGLLGLLTDGDGLFKIVGPYSADNYAKIIEWVGKDAEVSGKLVRHLDYLSAVNATTITLAPAAKPAGKPAGNK